MGYVFQISERNWRKFLKAKAAGEDPDLESLAVELGKVQSVTDMTRREARALLGLPASVSGNEGAGEDEHE
jgi:hypothetical protein